MLDTPEHPKESVSYVYVKREVTFRGEAIPIVADFPIYVDMKESERYIEKRRKFFV